MTLLRLLILALLLAPNFARAQDTVTVQTLTFDSVGRSGIYLFPTEGRFEKVIMQYTMHCKGSLVSDGNNRNKGCGEWDYNCETYIIDKSRVDSVKATWPSYRITNFSGSTYPYTSSPTKLITVRAGGLRDTITLAADTIVRYEIIGTDSIRAIDTMHKWLATYSYTVDTAGLRLDSVAVAAEDTIHIAQLPYYAKSPQKFEIMSFVTPYGIGLDLGKDGKMWQFDVTDYAPILRGEKGLSVERGAWQEELDIRFLFIKGTPPRDVIDIQQIWPVREENYQTIMADRHYEPRDINLLTEAKSFKLRSMITGHGQEGEFIPRLHSVTIGGQKYEWEVVLDCSSDPLYPQGGTWIYTRAGWCPGAATLLKEYDITSKVTPGTTVSADYTVKSGSGDSRYVVSNQLVSYGAPNFADDAAIVEIRKPSDRIEFARINPSCSDPVVVLRNTGSMPLTGATIEYFVDGGSPMTYLWSGNLAFLEEEAIQLPVPSPVFWGVGDTGVFRAIVHRVGNGSDEYAKNDTLTSRFLKPQTFNNPLVFHFRTNKTPGENYYDIRDASGTVVFSKTDFDASTTYFDSMWLAPGCYTFRLNDDGEDGIAFWANAAQGTGSFRIRENSRTGKVVKTLNPDFGKFSQLDFNVSGVVSVDDPQTMHRVSFYPNPAKETLNIELQGYVARLAKFEIVDATGKVQRTETRTGVGENLATAVSLRGLSKGSYYLRIVLDSDQATHAFVIE